MSHITVTKVLASKTQPIFIGWMDQWLYEDATPSITEEPLTAADLSEVLFSLDKRVKIVAGFNTAEYDYIPVAEYQDIPIGTDCIRPEFTFDNEFFQKMQIAPMKANFIYVPENDPPLFPEHGHYIARFAFVDLTGKSHPQSVGINII